MLQVDPWCPIAHRWDDVPQPQQPPPPYFSVFLCPIFMPWLLLWWYSLPPWPPSGLLTEYYSFPTLIPLLSLLRSYTPRSMLSYIIWLVYRNAYSTLKAVFAEVSRNINPFSFANRSPSSVLTCLLLSRSALLPMSMTIMSGLPFYLTSSNHRVRWLNVSFRVMS